jgi:hypothetical protein
MKPTVKILHSIHRRLAKRHHRKGDRGVVAVGMGWPMKDGKPDRDRGLELVYLVKKIKKRPRAGQKIPDKVRVFLTKGTGRRRKRYLATFTRHIMEMPTGVQLTGFELTRGTEVFTGGALIRWPDGNGGQSWGLLTVGHGTIAPRVRVALPGGAPVDCQVYAHTEANDALDAALVQLDPADVQSRLGPFLPPARPMPVVRSLADLSNNWQTEPPGCFLRTVAGPKAFNITHYFAGPTHPPLVPQEPNLEHILIGHGALETFAEGTSGSIWAAQAGPVDAIQVAGYPNDDDSALFSNGIAVSIGDYLDWASKQAGTAVTLMGAF